MTRYGAPGTGMSRRSFIKATGMSGLTASLAGCAAPNMAPQSTTDESRPVTKPPEVVDLDAQNHTVTISSVAARHEIHPLESMGGPVSLPHVWAFQADGGNPSVPGPILRTTEGHDLEITLDNTGNMHPHTLHFHGVQKSWRDDGAPTTTGVRVDPGEKHTYTIPANTTGTHLYHCHYRTPWHMEMGMYGILRVDPEGYEPADREYFLTIKDWDTRLSRSYGGEDVSYDIEHRRPDAFTINGKSAPRTLHPKKGSPVIVEQGETVRVHYVNAGFMSHPMHIHNHRVRTIEKDGGPIHNLVQHEEDMTNIAPAERYTIEFDANADPGIYPLHCHKVNHVRNGASYPGGMLSAVVYKDAMDTTVFADLMDAAGYTPEE